MYLNDSFHKVEILACELNFPVKTVTLTHRTVSKKKISFESRNAIEFVKHLY